MQIEESLLLSVLPEGMTGSAQRNVSVQPDTGPPKVRQTRSKSGGAWTVKDDPLEEGRVPSKEKEVSPYRPVARLRAKLVASPWYYGRLASAIRSAMSSKLFALVMVAALCLALFLPDMLVVAGASSNVWPDILLTLVMALFLVEMACLLVTDAAYMLSFFNLMDIIGTVSMISDISYILGTDATAANATDGRGGSTQASFILLRATRAAKIGARAGRLSRVVKLLRLLPCIAGQGEQQVGMAKVISTQLANLLATRVAGLTIVLVMIIPLFDILTFPQIDYSMRAWVQRLKVDHQDYGSSGLFVEELVSMSEFYKNKNYGPFTACLGYLGKRDGSDYFFCEEYFDHLWDPTFSKPPRKASIDLVYADDFMVGFNMWTPQRMQSGMTMLSILFIIAIMVFSGLALSSVVTELAVRPLERMLSTVRQIATTVFNFSSKVTEEPVDEETADINSASEMKLLEKVVNKLAVITDLQTRNEMDQIDQMEEEDIGIINMMQGRDVKADRAKNNRRSMAVGLKKGTVLRSATTPQTRWEELIGVPETLYLSWGLNALTLSKSQRVSLAVFTISQFHDRADGYVSTPEEEATLQKFVHIVEREYLPNPFHNFAHAVDVVHATAKLLRNMNSECFLTELEQYSLLIAALGHDLGHPGVNNGFLSEVGHELALQYNDRSPLENMHCAKLYTIIGSREANVFVNLEREQYKECRKNVIETILHTDMMEHMAMVKDLQLLYEMNCEVFEQSGVVVDGLPPEILPEEHEVFSKDDSTKILVMSTVLHAADVSNPCRTWEVTHAWAMKCLEEFFEQGDREKEFGIPVQFLNDREKLNRPNSQIGFIEFMIAPFVAAQIRLWPKLHEMGDNLSTNLASWEDMWAKEVSPAEEERSKVQGRVAKVKDTMEAAKMRTPKA
mmetsp:Transcript_1067/g.2443  ORF Transcript_1067/g.2443 Transcript_1067/m.2443 type:complete len:904 (-) Transcript_1067:130-2841(-)|eukprot:CAMPEP_0178373080 /NCGR_PEP_ID=MMETSP0689_2-20121128/1681_1 /TAXON_ID=160604 /ORGANISM="Amphidinium massartii, Strain CS-259" /LENGTH=903 /DNA_ID=CAMNT_0019993017 /DNA_START=89 /DNA_END=2800 /DNA_ORIENTATION=-